MDESSSVAPPLVSALMSAASGALSVAELLSIWKCVCRCVSLMSLRLRGKGADRLCTIAST